MAEMGPKSLGCCFVSKYAFVRIEGCNLIPTHLFPSLFIMFSIFSLACAHLYLVVVSIFIQLQLNASTPIYIQVQETSYNFTNSSYLKTWFKRPLEYVLFVSTKLHVELNNREFMLLLIKGFLCAGAYNCKNISYHRSQFELMWHIASAIETFESSDWRDTYIALTYSSFSIHKTA